MVMVVSHVLQLLGHDEPVVPNQCLARRSDSFLAVRCEWNVRVARVFTRQ